MTYELEHFKEFHDDPASFSDEDFRAKTLEWMIFVRETDGQYDFESEEWEEIGDRFFDELDARFPRTPELDAEYKAVNERILATDPKNRIGFINALRARRDFVKKYQVEFQFAHAYVKRCEEEFQYILGRYYEMKGADYEHRQAIGELDDALAEAYEKTGRVHSSTALRQPKRYGGN